MIKIPKTQDRAENNKNLFEALNKENHGFHGVVLDKVYNLYTLEEEKEYRELLKSLEAKHGVNEHDEINNIGVYGKLSVYNVHFWD